MTFPLNAFLGALWRCDRAKLHRADPVKMAVKYGIKPEHAAGYIRLEIGRA